MSGDMFICLLVDVLTTFRVILNFDLLSSYITKNSNFLDLYAAPVLTTASLCQRVITHSFKTFKNNTFFSLLGDGLIVTAL